MADFQQARDIYKRDYWDRIRGDEIISQAINQICLAKTPSGATMSQSTCNDGSNNE